MAKGVLKCQEITSRHCCYPINIFKHMSKAAACYSLNQPVSGHHGHEFLGVMVECLESNSCSVFRIPFRGKGAFKNR